MFKKLYAWLGFACFWLGLGYGLYVVVNTITAIFYNYKLLDVL